MHAGAGLYVHIPFCARICPYCDFAVLTGGRAAQRAFVDSLLGEIALHAGLDLGFDTLYLGGGTPSHLEPGELERLLAALRAGLRLDAEAWITLEANPEDLSPERLSAWRDLGVRTLSIGVQALDADSLRFLGRAHTPEQARSGVERAVAQDFPIVSIDLIYGYHGQDLSGWIETLELATALGAHHVSCYQLTIHEDTPFGRRRARGRLAELPDGAQSELFLATHRLLAARGYAAYEVSNFARTPAHRSRHNQKYWSHTPYLGLGPSAHSYVAGRRSWNERRFGAYRERIARGESPVAGDERLTGRELALEAVMLGLRTTEGLDLERLRDRFGVDLEAANRGRIERLEERGLIVRQGSRLVPTLEGLAVADALAAELELE